MHLTLLPINVHVSLSPLKIFNSESIPDLETAAQNNSILKHVTMSIISVTLDLATAVIDPYLNREGGNDCFLSNSSSTYSVHE